MIFIHVQTGHITTMKLVYTHQNSLLVGVVSSKLEQEGIKAVVRNEISSGAAGELAPTDAWPEVWVSRERDYERAKALVEQLSSSAAHAQWTCPKCGEVNDESFDFCWQCQYPAPIQ